MVCPPPYPNFKKKKEPQKIRVRPKKQIKKNYKIKKINDNREMVDFDFPKILHLYWDLSTFSFLNLLTIESFRRFHQGWKIMVHVPKEKNSTLHWKSFEHKLKLTGKSYFERLSQYPEVEIQVVDQFPDFLKDASEIIKSDYLRYWLLYENGGVWSDFDILYIRNMEPVLAQYKKTNNVIFRCLLNNDFYYPIGLFIAQKKTPLFRYILDQCEKHYNKDYYQTIGASMWNSLFPDPNKLLKVDSETVILDNEFYLPLQCDKFEEIFLKNEYQHFPENTIGVHWFNGSNQSKHYQNSLDSRCLSEKAWESHTPTVWIDNYVRSYVKTKCILLFSESSYPGGGGEEFMLDVARFFHGKAYKVYWMNMHDWGKPHYTKEETIEKQYFTQLRIPKNVNDSSNFDYLRIFLNKYEISFIFTQGCGHKLFCDLGNVLLIPTISIWCFWEEALQIDWNYGLQNIEKNLDKHNTCPDFLYTFENLDYVYFASEFVRHILSKKYKFSFPSEHVLPTYPQNKRSLIQSRDNYKNDFITLFDVHTLKGAKVFAAMIEKFPKQAFLGVKTEDEEEGPKVIQAAMDKVKQPKNKLLYTRENDVKKLYAQTKIVLMPTYLDETFGRVVYESFTNHIPVIYSNRGNLQFIKGPSLLQVNMDDDKVLESIESYLRNLLTDQAFYQKVVDAQIEYLQSVSSQFSLQRLESKFLDVQEALEKRIGIFTPWCDQGLGIQSRIYKYLFEKMGYKVFIFATKPYLSTNVANLTNEKKEWITNNIYRSPNRRLDVQNVEVKLFVENYRIRKMLIPEIRYEQIFKLCRYLKTLNVKTYALPNIDCVKADEIPKYNEFYKVGLNNQFCGEVLKTNNFFYSEYVGFHYAIPPCIPYNDTVRLVENEKVHILHLTGLNGLEKKNTLQILETLEKVYETRKNFKVTIIIQGNFQKDKTMFDRPFIRLVGQHLSYAQILGHYHEAHLSIHMSKNEGLALGLFESCFMHTPVMTMDAYPYKEIIIPQQNGWLVPSHTEEEPVCHVQDLAVHQNRFKTNDAVKVLGQILDDIKGLNKVIKSTRSTLEANYGYAQFESRLREFFY